MSSTKSSRLQGTIERLGFNCYKSMAWEQPFAVIALANGTKAYWWFTDEELFNSLRIGQEITAFVYPSDYYGQTCRRVKRIIP